MDDKKMDLEAFGDIMDNFINDNEVCLLAESPAGTQDFTIKTNTNLGPVVEFYMLIKCIPDVFVHFKDILDESLTENFIDSVLEMLKEEIMEKLQEEHNADGSKLN